MNITYQLSIAQAYGNAAGWNFNRSLRRYAAFAIPLRQPKKEAQHAKPEKN